ncbi:hypothetical protein pb186bvf_003612 [Paramecium bursaria]
MEKEKSQLKGKKMNNRKNITDGEIKLNQIEEKDKVPEEYQGQEYDSNLIKYLELDPQKERYFIENLKDGSFIEVQQQQLKRRKQQLEDANKRILEPEDAFGLLNQVVNDTVKLIDRFIFFFQGLVTGMNIALLLVLRLYQSDANVSNTQFNILLNSLVIRLDQIFHLFLIISSFGAIFVSLQLKAQFEVTRHPNHQKFYIQGVLSAIFYSIAYYLWMAGHIFVGYSLGSLTSATEMNTSYIESWQITQIIQTVVQILQKVQFVILGWFVSVSTTESNIDYLTQVQIDQDQSTDAD